MPTKRTIAIHTGEAAPRTKQTSYPEPFATRMRGRVKHTLGDLFGLTNFGVNLTRIAPGGISALRHTHTKQDEFIYVVSGHPVLKTNAGDTPLAPGMCAGFKAGDGDAHHLVNPTAEDVVYLEVGDRTAADEVIYPDDDIQAVLGADGAWSFRRKDGTGY